MPPGPDCEKLRELVEKRKEIDCNNENVFMKFKDSRRGIFNIGKKMFGMKLVDLPCIIESQKTFDNKHVFKVADICQMIQVDDVPITDEHSVSQGNFNIEDFIYPHGITPPLHHVRKRRFRKRLNKRTIETVERAVERLLEEDSRADQVIIDIVDNVRDLSDSEGEDYQPPSSATGLDGNVPSSKVVYNKARPSISHSKRSPSHLPHQTDRATSVADSIARSDAPMDSHIHATVETPAGESVGGQTPAPDFDEFGEDPTTIGYQEDDDEGSIDSDLAAEIEAGLMEGAAAEERAAAGLTGPEDGDDDDDSEDLFGNGDDDDEDDEDEDDDDDEEESNQTIQDKQRVRLLQGELKDLEAAINRKRGEIAKAANVILRKRFEEALKKLTIELESKKTQLNTTQQNLENAAKERKNFQQRQEKGEEVMEGDREIPQDSNDEIIQTPDPRLGLRTELDVIPESSEMPMPSAVDQHMNQGDDEPMLSVEEDIPAVPDSMDIDVMVP